MSLMHSWLILWPGLEGREVLIVCETELTIS